MRDRNDSADLRGNRHGGRRGASAWRSVRRADGERRGGSWMGRAQCAVAIAALTVAMAESAAAQQPCTADCAGDGRVSIDELVLAVAIALGEQPAAACPAADAGADGRVTIDELIGAVRVALAGCAPTRSATATATATATASATNSASATPSATAPLPASATSTVTAAPAVTATRTVPALSTATATPAASASAAPSATATALPSPTPPPNIILINLDDSRADGIDEMPTVQTRLIDRGVRFSNSFVPLALCCPSRASILTGLYALHHGTRRIEGRIGGAHTFRESEMDHRTVAVWLQSAGYVTGLFGKYLNLYRDEGNKGPAQGFYVPPGWSRWRAFVDERYGGRNGSDYELVDESAARTAYVDHGSDAQYSTTLLASELRGFIADAAAARRPFFAVWAPYASHIDAPDLLPIPTVQYLDAFNGLVPWRPPNWNELDRSDKPRWVQALGISPSATAATDLARQRAYETLLSVDDEIARLLDQLVALGIDANTVIVLTSDNAVFWGEHAQFGGFTKEGPYEECVRVPLVVRDPRRTVGLPRVAETPVLNIDVPITIAALAGVSPPPVVDGISFAAALDGDTTPLRQDFLLEHWGPRGATLTFRGQPLDGDRMRVYFGTWPKASLAFEFDGDGTVAPDSVAVPLQETAAASFAQLGALIRANVASARPFQQGNALIVLDVSAHALGIAWTDEVDGGGTIDVSEPIPDFFGVRDVANGFTYVEYADGEVELYDLSADPWQLDSRAGDPAYADVRARLAARTRELMQ